MRDATLYIDDKAVSHNNFNPRVLCGTRRDEDDIDEDDDISIHASYAGRDTIVKDNYPEIGISIHASYAGRDERNGI